MTTRETVEESAEALTAALSEAEALFAKHWLAAAYITIHDQPGAVGFQRLNNKLVFAYRAATNDFPLVIGSAPLFARIALAKSLNALWTECRKAQSELDASIDRATAIARTWVADYKKENPEE